ncbi:response regulator transcription factor [Parvibacter caecicola]|uniref:DNA-binding response OmpR family regulator n=1 Tax=Parvibacter caecicola TaxID=747645 RepID=A0A3N0A9C2_9ACTN|nr:response regulator transcription factor [Parvibacter caecicola]MBB3171614.1 DNA-binding response OmpR family regulator [Parvibacter caecicola]MCR2040874.1 response regulator transcription factor [Parvibacter caecicola]RNL10693.1 DNA-binding response regulator [Parvibacter caecicola]TJW10264.1 response regulator transcription factor [Parvibacter caecicola]
MTQKILVVDDEPMLTDLLDAHLTQRGYLVWKVNNAEDALAKLTLKPDLILLDIGMPGIDGLQLCQTIRSHVGCPILFLTARITEQDKIDGLAVGGDDYITKPFSLRELTARIEAHLRREVRGSQTSEVVAAQGLLINRSQRKVFAGNREIAFSKREFDILDFLASHPNQVFDRERIYTAVWGIDGQGDAGVVKEHVRKIRQKLLKACGSEPIETVWGMGYRWKA